MDAAQIVAELERLPLHSVEQAKATNGVPAAPGFYAWWAIPDAIPCVVAPYHHPSVDLVLFYVGIAPRAATSGAQLRSRLCHQHIGGNVASSTFRFDLAALLWEDSGWTLRRSPSGKVRLDASDNGALSSWQRDHLRLRWAVVDEPWLYEAEVVMTMRPALNRDHNQNHPFYIKMGLVRDHLRKAALMH